MAGCFTVWTALRPSLRMRSESWLRRHVGGVKIGGAQPGFASACAQQPKGIERVQTVAVDIQLQLKLLSHVRSILWSRQVAP